MKRALRRPAKRDFGNVPLVEDVTRDTWGWSAQDFRLGLRILLKYPGLTIAGGIALAIAIGLGAGWYDLSQQIFRPALPLPDGRRLVEIEMANVLASESEPRLLYDFVNWRRDLRTVEDLSAYRTIERNVAVTGSVPVPVTIAEVTASAFGAARVPARLGRALVAADEQPGAPDVIVIGHRLWQRAFGGRPSVVGEVVQIGPAAATVVGVMPEGFAFPVNHEAWIPLRLNPSGYAPLEGGPIRVFGRLAPGATHLQVSTELEALEQRAAAASPQTHANLRTDVDAYGGESSDRGLLEYAATHAPILLALAVACTTVGTLVYARTATREAEIAVRSALGASRRRIVMQLFVEALVLASVAAVVGLAAAHWSLTWGLAAFYSGQPGGAPFWMHAGLQWTTILYAAGLAVAAAAMLSILPALKATGSKTQAHLQNLGGGRSTLRFGGVWSTVMILQVTLTVIAVPPAMGIAGEALRDRAIRSQFPADRYLAVPLELDRASGPAGESEAAYAARVERVYGELERRLAGEPGVVSVTFGDRLPGMDVSVRRIEVEVSPAEAPVPAGDVWTAATGPGYFDAFDKPIVAGRAFNASDRTGDARTVIVNEAFARRRFMNGVNPLGRRLRYTSSDATAAPQPWLEIVGIVRDIGMTPTDLGEAAYVFHPVSPSTASQIVMGVRATGDAAALAPSVRAVAAAIEPGLRLGDVRRLDDVVWRQDIAGMVAAGALVAVIALGLFLSAAGLFALMSVSVARRTREIGLRAALGASSSMLLRSIVSRALLLVGSGVAAGNTVILLIMLSAEVVPWTFFVRGMLVTSALMLTAGMLACIGPARRALRINPTDALKEC